MRITRKLAGRKRGSKTRFLNIVANANKLGVTPSHLWRVLVGQRQSTRLSARYQALKSGSPFQNPLIAEHGLAVVPKSALRKTKKS